MSDSTATTESGTAAASSASADPRIDAARVALDGLSDVLRSWASTSGSASPGGIEPAYYLDYQALDDLYRANTYAAKICDALPDEATRRAWEISYGKTDEGEDDSPDADEDPIDDELWRLGLRAQLNHAGKLARKDGLAAIYLGVLDGQETREPINEAAIQRVTHCTLVEQYQLQPYSWQTDFTKPFFGEPEVYQITPYVAGAAATGVQGGTVYVHRSRLLLLSGKWLPPRLQATNANAPDSVLQRCWRLVQDFRRSEGDLGVLLRSFSQPTLTLPTLAQLLAGGNKAAALERLMLVNVSRSVSGMALLGENEKLEYVTRSVAGVAELFDRLAQGLAAAAEMPLTLLFGHAPSGLSTDDSAGRTYWYARVAAYQTQDLQPHVEYVGHLCCLAQQGPCKGQEPEHWEVGWLPLTEPTETEKTDQRAKQATTDRAYWDMEVLSSEEIRQSRFGSGAYSGETRLIAGVGPGEGDDEGVDGEGPISPEDQAAAAAEALAEARAAALLKAPGAQGVGQGKQAQPATKEQDRDEAAARAAAPKE